MWVESLKLISDNNHCFSIPQKGQIFPLTSAILRLLKIPGTFALMSSKLCKILKEMRILDHLTCLLRNLYAGQEATVRTGHGTTDWLQIGKEYLKAVYCHHAYLTYMQSTL